MKPSDTEIVTRLKDKAEVRAEELRELRERFEELDKELVEIQTLNEAGVPLPETEVAIGIGDRVVHYRSELAYSRRAGFVIRCYESCDGGKNWERCDEKPLRNASPELQVTADGRLDYLLEQLRGGGNST